MFSTQPKVDPRPAIAHKKHARARATPKIPRERIEKRSMPVPRNPPNLPPIHTIRRQRVVLDSDLAWLYGVPTKVFNQTIQRNAARFPSDFAFQINREEFAYLKSQIVTSSTEGPETGTLRPPIVPAMSGAHGGIRKLPWTFTEHGAIMAATLLRSPRAIAMSVYVVRAFVQMKEALLANATIIKRLAEIDKKLITHDVILRDVYEKLRPLMAPPPEPPQKEIGFHTRLKK